MKNKIFIITGKQGSGKTTFLSQVIKELENYGIQLNGFVAEGFWSNNERSHFELVDLSSKERILFCTKEKKPGWELIGHFYINPAAKKFSEKILNPLNLNRCEICVIDEIGPFELQGKGWHNAINQIVKNTSAIPMIWVVRESLVQKVIAHFELNFFSLYQADSKQLKSIVNDILNFLTVKSKGMLNH